MKNKIYEDINAIAKVSFEGSSDLTLKDCFEVLLTQNRSKFKTVASFLASKSDKAKGAFNALFNQAQYDRENLFIRTTINSTLNSMGIETIPVPTKLDGATAQPPLPCLNIVGLKS